MSIYRKKRGIFVNILLAYRYGWVDHILHSRPQVTEETLTTHIYIQLRNMHSFDSLREEQHFAAGCTLFQQLERKRVGRVHVGQQAHFSTYVSSLNFKTGRFEAEVMSLSLFHYCFCNCLCRCHNFNLSSCRLSPFHLSNVTVSRPCHLWNFILNRASTIGESYCSPHVRESEIQGLGIRNTSQGIRNPSSTEKDLEYSTWNSESTEWNPESKTVLDSPKWGRYCDV